MSSSILGRAQKGRKFSVSLYNPRDFTKDQPALSGRKAGGKAGKRRKIDSRPYGGGPGMILQAEPMLRAADKAIGSKAKVKKIFLSPRGRQFDTKYAKRLAKNYTHILLLSGHYEGVDARVRKALSAEEVSIGPYTLTGGELPAMVVIDAVARQLPGVLGKHESLEETRVAGKDIYTRPKEIVYKKKKYLVPKILQSGHHKEIEKWKKKH